MFEETTSAVAAALATVKDRQRLGQRDGQYDLDLVTDAAALEVLVSAGVGIVSEESGLHEPERDLVVVIDPVDGSTNCSRGIPWYACSLAAVDAEGVVAAMVTNLASGVTYRAVRGEGATRDGEAIATSGCASLGDAMLALNGWSPRHLGWRQYRSLGATALDLCLVADGGLDGYLDCANQNGTWDYMAAALIVDEAGGTVRDAFGRELVLIDHAVRRAPLAAASAPLSFELADAHAGMIRSIEAAS